MNTPIDKQNIDNFSDEDIHEQAGLIFSGINFEGETEWIGTKLQWEKYERLLNNE